MLQVFFLCRFVAVAIIWSTYYYEKTRSAFFLKTIANIVNYSEESALTIMKSIIPKITTTKDTKNIMKKRWRVINRYVHPHLPCLLSLLLLFFILFFVRCLIYIFSFLFLLVLRLFVGCFFLVDFWYLSV